MRIEQRFHQCATGTLRRIALIILSAVLAAPIAAAQPSVQSSVQSSVLADLPLEIRPPSESLYAQATVVGTDTYVCGATDILAWTWLPQSSQAQLLDAAHRTLGRFSNRMTIVAPRMSSETVWRDQDGGRVVATRSASGRLPVDARRMWTRYDVQSRSGDGPFTALRSIIRVSPTRITRPSGPCDRAHYGSRAELPLQATDLLIK